MNRVSFSGASLDTILDAVDIDIGYISVGFLEQTRKQRRSIRDGTSRSEENNAIFARAALSAGSGVDSCVPLMSLLIAIVRGYTSTLRWRHCEVAVWLRSDAVASDRRRRLLSIGVQGEAVFIEAREFDENYHWVNVGIERESLIALLTMAVMLRGQRFSMESMSRSALLPGPEQSDERNGIFCSQLAAKLLSVLPHPSAQLRRPNAQSVDDIHELVTQPEFRPEVPIAQLAPARLFEYDTLAPVAARAAAGRVQRV